MSSMISSDISALLESDIACSEHLSGKETVCKFYEAGFSEWLFRMSVWLRLLLSIMRHFNPQEHHPKQRWEARRSIRLS